MTGAAPLSEAQFQRQVLDLARILGWSAYHPMLSKWSERGWPDLVLCRPPRLVFIELKRETGKTTSHQDRWLYLLGACPGVETHLFRPSDFDRITEVLR
jgi:hypothetical protein